MSGIVVGVDGSAGSRQALAWAIEEASLRGVHLKVIHTFEPKPAWAAYGYEDEINVRAWKEKRESIESTSRQAAEHAQALVQSMVAEAGATDAEAIAIESNRPSETLVDQSKGADLLVVGSRGRGGFQSLLLGSVSQQCAHHAECPVVIIRSSPAS